MLGSPASRSVWRSGLIQSPGRVALQCPLPSCTAVPGDHLLGCQLAVRRDELRSSASPIGGGEKRTCRSVYQRRKASPPPCPPLHRPLTVLRRSFIFRLWPPPRTIHESHPMDIPTNPPPAHCATVPKHRRHGTHTPAQPTHRRTLCCPQQPQRVLLLGAAMIARMVVPVNRFRARPHPLMDVVTRPSGQLARLARARSRMDGSAGPRTPSSTRCM